MLNVSKITVDRLADPCGIGDIPTLGWQLQSGARNVLQKSYRAQIALDRAFERPVWDSGLVQSAESAEIWPQGLRLASSTEYFVRVRVSDGTETSPWGGPARFTTGLLLQEDWKAAFISAETAADAAVSKGTLLRTGFDVEDEVASAVVYASALGLYTLYLNGARVGRDELAPGWTSYRRHLMVQSYDVTDRVRRGQNALGAMVGAGWYKGLMGFLGLRNNYGLRTALLCQLVITLKDGRKKTVCTGADWRCSDAPVTFAEIYDGETYDARLEQPGWCEPGFDASGWRPAEVLAFGGEAPARSALTAQPGCRVREAERFPALRVFCTPQGDTVLDFGQNLSGWVHFRVRGQAGDRVVLRHFETLDAAGNVYLANLRSAKQTVDYTLRGTDTEEYRPHFTYQGFRYVKVEAYPGKVKTEDFEAVAVHSDLPEIGWFECSNTLLNGLQHNIHWSMLDNFVDIPTDCPQRNERMGWTGDAQIFCRTASFLADTDVFFRKWLRDVAADQTPEGGVPHVVPDIVSGKCEHDWLLSQGSHSAAAWADAAVIIPWTLYLMYGDVRVLHDQFDSMKAWVDFMRSHADGVIWNYKLQFGDWVALDAAEGSYFGATPNDLTCTAYYAYTTGLFARICGVLGRTAEQREYSGLYSRIVRGFQEKFFTPDGSLTARTQTAHIVALYFRLVPEQYVQKTVDTLLELLRERGGHLVTGFVGTPYFCRVLSENGHAREAYELLLKEDFPSWLYQVKKGATTVWEHWDGIRPDGTMWSPDMNSLNHYAYGAVGDWLYRTAAGLGVDEDRPGGRHYVIRPCIGGGLTWARAGFDGVCGPVAADWRLENGLVTLSVTLPANACARVVLENAGELCEDSDVSFEACAGGLAADIGSGDYRFVYREA